ncbi:exosome non-catalytic core subunit rrp40 [Peltigera leucophlebia]|nr:exosome non-catalytic core subunit rrp40 [Peltigera leucophlebia]
MPAASFVIPGDIIPTEDLPMPSNGSKPLKLGPGLRHTPPSTISAVLAGSLCIEPKKNAIWVENSTGRYIPQIHDVVIATVHHSSTDFFHCAISPYTTFAQLPHLAFEGASKKTRPQLVAGSLIYARVTSASKFMDPELVCVNPSTGKSEGMGELKGGMVFSLSLGMSRSLLAKKQTNEGGQLVLEEMAKKLAFEVAIGRNGLVWVKADGVRETLLVGRALQKADKASFGVEEK